MQLSHPSVLQQRKQFTECRGKDSRTTTTVAHVTFQPSKVLS
uniref:Uncharacterized protein n=1 Tax=Rhizophora mucronata TaxID=61149 RepID=A0A2P2JRS5_RHIMU